MARTYDSVQALINTGFTYLDAVQLRRISMTLHRWHELECGDGNDHASWCITRGKMHKKMSGSVRVYNFEHDENGAPFMERHCYQSGGRDSVSYTRIPDRASGAVKRLCKIMANYPELSFYVQSDPRGAALYILRPGDVPKGEAAESYYSRGIVVCK